MSLKIWGRRSSVNVQKVMWAVAELGLSHERIDAGGTFGRTAEPGYRAMNPNGLIPVLQDGPFTLWESNAIVRYLVHKHGAGKLAPASLETFATADQWMDWAATSLYHDIITTIFWGLVRTPKSERNEAAIKTAAARVGEKLGILDGILANRDYILGETLTMADIPAGALMYRYFALPIARPNLPNVSRWAARLEARPAYATHVMIDYAELKVAGA